MSVRAKITIQRRSELFFLFFFTKNYTTFFHPKTENNPDRKQTLEQKTDPDPDCGQ
jgi:hypothetical protein